MVFKIWYKSSLILDLTFSREKFYKNFYLTDTLLNFGLKLVKKDFENLILTKEWPIKFNLNFLLDIIEKKTKLKYKDFSSEMILNKNPNSFKIINIYINLYCKNKKNPIFTLCCDIKKEEIPNDSKNEQVLQQFTIKNYNFGTPF
ncbi:hypothetical protein GF385_04565 [Candidatus Dependentiae bacterium]|nr:hypothetical protein [Candidatus Dependentiae bacterium]